MGPRSIIGIMGLFFTITFSSICSTGKRFVFKTDNCVRSSILALLFDYQEYLVAFKWCKWYKEHGQIYKQQPPFGKKICSDICPRALSVPRSEQFSKSKARGNCVLRGTDNVQGQISEHIFFPNGGYCLYNFIILQLFLTKAAQF